MLLVDVTCGFVQTLLMAPSWKVCSLWILQGVGLMKPLPDAELWQGHCGRTRCSGSTLLCLQFATECDFCTLQHPVSAWNVWLYLMILDVACPTGDFLHHSKQYDYGYDYT